MQYVKYICSDSNIEFLQKSIQIRIFEKTGLRIPKQKNINEVIVNILELEPREINCLMDN